MIDMRVAHLTSVHARYDARIFMRECRSLSKLGYDVTLVVADGQGEELRDGVAILDVGRPNGRLMRMWHTVNAVAKTAIGLKADVYHLHDPELLRIVSRIKRHNKSCQIIFDVHEDYTAQIAAKAYLPFWFRVFLSKVYSVYERQRAGILDAIVVATDQQVGRFRLGTKKVVVVQNFPDLSVFPERDVVFDHARVFHAGSLNSVRGLDAMVTLAKMPTMPGKIVLAGPLSLAAEKSSLAPVQYLGVLEQPDLVDQYMNSNIGLILYKPVGQYGMATAIKLYEYMAASMPVIVPNHGEWPGVVAKIGCGIAVDVDDPGQQVDAIQFLLSHPEEAAVMGKRGRAYVLENALWSSAFSRLEQLYRSLGVNCV